MSPNVQPPRETVWAPRGEAAPQEPEAFLESVRAALTRRTVLGQVALGAALVLGGFLLVLIVAALAGPSGAWRPLLGLLGLGWVVGVGVAIERARRTFRDDAVVARHVDRQLPAVAGELLAAIELERELPRLDAQPRWSAQLQRALRRRVAERLAGVDGRALVDERPMRRRALLQLGAAGLAWAIALVAFRGGLERGLEALTQSRADRYVTSLEPIVGDIQLELRYPAYTSLPPRVIPGSSGQVLALPGTEVRIQARALKDASAARLLRVEDGAPKALAEPAEVKEGALSARFIARKPGSWRFQLDGAQGRVQEPEAHRVELEPDRPPRVDLYAPAESLEVAGPRRVELGYAVDDDYGVGEVELVWRIGDRPPARRVVRPAPSANERSAAGKLEWDLSELDLQPGVRVAYHLEVKDNDTVSGPNVGVSRTFYLTMFSPRQKHEARVAAEAQLLEQMIALLGDRLEAKHGDDGELTEPFGRIHAQAESLLVELGKTEAALDNDKQGPADVRKELREMHARLGKLSKDEEALLSDLRDKRHKGTPPKGHGLDGQNRAQVAELERDVIALDDLLGRQRLEELLQVGDEMARTRDRLKQLMAEYKKTRSEALRKDIERELRELERKLAELREKASRLASELPDQFLNREAMGKNDVQGRLDKIRDLLQKGDVEQAMAELEKMSSSLDQMMASMENDLKGFRGERFSAEEKAMAELENQLTDLQHDEQQLKQETGQIRERARQEAQRQMRDKVHPFVKQARDKVTQLKKQLGEIEPRALSPYDVEELQRVKQRVEDLDKMLQAGDLDEARGMARQADQGLEGMKADLRDEEARAWRGPRPGAKKAREHVEESEAIARQLAEQIDKTVPKPGDLMSPEDQQKMGELSERQKAARRRAQEIARELDKKVGPDGKPIALPQPVREGLGEAGQHMERAEGQLKRRDPRDAEGEEGQALDKLAKLKDQLQQQRRPREQQSSGNVDKEPVKIPGADEYKAPREFRQDLLDAMKRGAPSEYKEQVKRYYEELVK